MPVVLPSAAKSFGLWIERVHVRHAAIREDEDDALRLRREMRRLRRERVSHAGIRFREQLGENARHQQRTANEGAEDFATMEKT